MPTALDASSTIGLISAYVLTANLLLGLLLGMKYNPWKQWPHVRINYFRIHNWTGYTALALALLHPVLLLFDRSLKFGLWEIVWPLAGPKQPVVNMVGGVCLWVLIVVVVTSYFRKTMNRRKWKLIHFSAYAVAVLAMIHGLLADPSLKDHAIDYIDAEKVSVEVCALIIVVATAYRVRWRLQLRARRAAS
ncbi:MAG: hypothetical protein JWO05_981 [Gemmatimonadetes bacterium]|nr:hypothetical protein [Gemmatimonadota bacterium]